jgi:hypothetical protein
MTGHCWRGGGGMLTATTDEVRRLRQMIDELRQMREHYEPKSNQRTWLTASGPGPIPFVTFRSAAPIETIASSTSERQPLNMAFVGSHVGVTDLSQDLLYGTATRLNLLNRWTTGTFHNVRTMTPGAITMGSRFLADEAIADRAAYRDHIYEVTKYEPPRTFAIRCIRGPLYVGELNLWAQENLTHVRWEVTAASGNAIERVLAVLFSRRVQRQVQRQVAREVEQLIKLGRLEGGGGSASG